MFILFICFGFVVYLSEQKACGSKFKNVFHDEVYIEGQRCCQQLEMLCLLSCLIVCLTSAKKSFVIKDSLVV